jgi:hypothetical protein
MAALLAEVVDAGARLSSRVLRMVLAGAAARMVAG